MAKASEIICANPNVAIGTVRTHESNVGNMFIGLNESYIHLITILAACRRR